MSAATGSGAGGALWAALRESAEAGAGRPALRIGAEQWSLAEILERAELRAARLREELPRGPLFLTPRSSLDSVVTLIGAIAAERVPVLADAAWTAPELEQAMARCGAGGLLSEDGELRRREPAHELDLEGVAFGRFTSGSTGAPRCLAFGAGAALAAARGWATTAGYGPEDEVLCLATLNNGLGFNASLFPALLAGSCLTLHSGRLVRSSIVKLLAAVEPTVLVAFPFVYEQLVDAPGAAGSLRRLRLAVSSAARLAESTKAAWAELSGIAVCDYYGLAEVGPCTFNDGSRPDSLGRPLPACELRVTDDWGQVCAAGTVGRLRVRTPSMAADFLDAEQPRLAAGRDANGFFVSQDVGWLDEEGRLYLTGRIGRQVNVAGRKVEPSEVEGVLRDLPGVSAAIVVAEPSGSTNVLAAYVETESVARQEVVAHCAERLASYKIPQAIHLVAELPRSSSGKVSAGALAARAQGAER